MRMTCASFERSDPRGFSRSSVSAVAGGTELPSASRRGAPIGGPASTDAATADCQSLRSTSTTAVGRSDSFVAGNSALATPAASVVASPPPIRTVLRVAVNGESELLGRPVVASRGAHLAGPRVVVAEAATGEREGGGQSGGECGKRPAQVAAHDSYGVGVAD